MEEMASAPNVGGHLHPGFNLLSHSGQPNLQWPQQFPRDLARHPQRTVPLTSPFTSDMFGPDATVDETRNLQYHRNNEIPHPDVMRRRNPSYQRPYRQSSTHFNSPDRRQSARSADGPVPLSELSTPARNQNRRSFDRYSTDVPSGAIVPNGPIRSPSSRAAGTSYFAQSYVLQ